MSKVLRMVEFYKKIAQEHGLFDNYANKIISDNAYMAKSLKHSGAIEGNTITEIDTYNIITNAIPIQMALQKYREEEVYEIIGLKQAHQFMYQTLNQPLTMDFLLELHHLLYKPIEKLHMGIFAGEFRTYEVFTYRQDGTQKFYLDPDFIDDEVENMIEYYNNSSKSLENICELKLEFIHIHPFGDGNGRTSRLLLNWALMSNGYPPIIIKVEDKRKYIDTMDIYKVGEENKAFYEFIGENLIEAYKDMLG